MVAKLCHEEVTTQSPLLPDSKFRNSLKLLGKHESVEENKMKNLLRCVSLLEHVAGCQDTAGVCVEGGGCRRTRQVLMHHRSCGRPQASCVICLQLKALCLVHSEHCQKAEGSCVILDCRNGKPHRQLKTGSSGRNEKYREDMKKLLKACQLPSVMERKHIIQQLYNNSPSTTIRLLRELYKLKRSNDLRPSRQMYQHQPCDAADHFCHNRAMNTGIKSKASDEWKARVNIVPIDGKKYRSI